MRRIDRIKELRGILTDIDKKCDGCVHIGTWYCNRDCDIPAIKAVAEMLLKMDGAYVHNEKKRGDSP